MINIKKLWEICLKTIVEAEALKKEVELLHEKEKALKLACSKLADYIDNPPTLENKDNIPETVAECWELYFSEKVRDEK